MKLQQSPENNPHPIPYQFGVTSSPNPPSIDPKLLPPRSSAQDYPPENLGPIARIRLTIESWVKRFRLLLTLESAC
ncbi:hypothetical protein [Roseofilum sp. Belize Diploria]|uniref:hypothetical protein n=1 Tax=Roseofilum sp. Belize Diploria TaxID=2821501 RepID=UPI001B0DEF7D|nr:hypothetical protein [Roseofilum sp. Belize Diploria]MBP0009583.1 hypothetical protein [Roseofilum sp. Belize Diploria]